MLDSLTTDTLTTDILTTDTSTTDSLMTDTSTTDPLMMDTLMTDTSTTENIDLTNADNSDPQATESTDSLYPEDTSNSPSETDNSVFNDPTSQDNDLDNSQDNSQDNVPAPIENGGNVIDVDNDFGGDLQSAIAAANSGDVVRLGNNTYSASGITIDKDITLNGQEGSVIDGGGSADSILNVTQDASGATIQNIEITNGNNGIYGFGASNVTLQNLDINNIGISQTMTDGENNTGIVFNRGDGLRISNTDLSNIGRKGIGIGDTVGAVISDVSVENVNLDAQHAVNHDAAGVKFYNTTDSIIQNSYFSNNYANSIWPDTTTGTVISNNTVEGVVAGDISGIYQEKSPNSTVSNNSVTGVDGHVSFDATALTTETLDLGENDFSNQLLNTEDYFVNPGAETLIATTEDPLQANFDLIASDYIAGNVIS
jgi:Right handed beta helix region